MRVLVLSDLHVPFQHKDAYAFIKSLLRKYQPQEVVFIGDLTDQHAISKWEHDPDGDAAGPELQKTIKALRPLYKMIPKAKVCLGNHDMRAYKRAFSAGIPKVFLRSLSETLQAPPTWEWAIHFVLDGVRYEHGDAAGERSSGSTAIRNLPIKNMQSTVFGHFHVHAGIEYAANPRMLYFGMNVGCLIDKDAYAFEYGKMWKTKPIISCGLVLQGRPYLIPMELDTNGRWTGKNKGIE